MSEDVQIKEQSAIVSNGKVYVSLKFTAPEGVKLGAIPLYGYEDEVTMYAAFSTTKPVTHKRKKKTEEAPSEEGEAPPSEGS